VKELIDEQGGDGRGRWRVVKAEKLREQRKLKCQEKQGEVWTKHQHGCFYYPCR
jgi:hypothetical protein